MLAIKNKQFIGFLTILFALLGMCLLVLWIPTANASSNEAYPNGTGYPTDNNGENGSGGDSGYPSGTNSNGNSDSADSQSNPEPRTPPNKAAPSGANNNTNESGESSFNVGDGVPAQTTDSLADDRGNLEGVVAFELSNWAGGTVPFSHEFSMKTQSPHALALWDDNGIESSDIQVLCLNDKGQWIDSSVPSTKIIVTHKIDAETGETIDYEVVVEAEIKQHGLCGLFVRNNTLSDENVQGRA